MGKLLGAGSGFGDCSAAALQCRSWISDDAILCLDRLDAGHFQRYLRALFFIWCTLASVGYGDVKAITYGETIYCICVIIFGGSALGVATSLLSSKHGLHEHNSFFSFRCAGLADGAVRRRRSI